MRRFESSRPSHKILGKNNHLDRNYQAFPSLTRAFSLAEISICFQGFQIVAGCSTRHGRDMVLMFDRLIDAISYRGDRHADRPKSPECLRRIHTHFDGKRIANWLPANSRPGITTQGWPRKFPRQRCAGDCVSQAKARFRLAPETAAGANWSLDRNR
jgi:hypothetical protein